MHLTQPKPVTDLCAYLCAYLSSRPLGKQLRRRPAGWQRFRLRAMLVMILALTSSGVAAQNNSVNSTSTAMPDFEHMQKQAMELKQSVLTYGANQRQQLLNETEVALENFDQRIAELETAIAAREDELSRAAQRYANNLLETLQRQRNEFGDWVTNLRTHSDTTWDVMMQGYSSAFDQFYNARETLESEFGAATFQ